MDSFLNVVAKLVRSWMLEPARVINTLSRGRVTPNHITLVSLLGHGLVVWALWNARPIVAALLLVFFGLMDALDGALARVQNKTSVQGMFYDAKSDRLKESLVYVGIAIYYWASSGYYDGSDNSWIIRLNSNVGWIPVAALGLSLLVSYIKAKGEMALSSTGKYDPQKLNRIFSDGFARYEVRMALIIIGLLTNSLLLAMLILITLLIFTALQRTIKVSKALKNV